VAGDLSGSVVTATNPTGAAAAWTVTHLEAQGLDAVSCPSASLCVAVDNLGQVETTSTPTGDASASTLARVDGFNALLGVSCPSAALCVAVDGSGNAVVGTPTMVGATHNLTVSLAGTGAGTVTGTRRAWLLDRDRAPLPALVSHAYARPSPRAVRATR
jgi:hypothetical protein